MVHAREPRPRRGRSGVAAVETLVRLGSGAIASKTWRRVPGHVAAVPDEGGARATPSSIVNVTAPARRATAR